MTNIPYLCSMQTTTIITNLNGKEINIESDNELVFDSEAIDYISKVLNKNDVSRYIQLGLLASNTYNILEYSDDTPYPQLHTANTLIKYLNMEKSKFYVLMRKLIKYNMAAHITICKGRKKAYLINPYLIRRFNNRFHPILMEQFKPVAVLFNELDCINN